ncbi:MAG: sulfatase-like hydrolase/transferase [Calditrichaeota bacterium]|nr:sulfatase-like hydrolase/transferase [Calditrichota bacterium]
MAEKSAKSGKSVAYSRREFVKTSAGALALAGLRTVWPITTRDGRPNIVLIMTDEHNGGVLGTAGDRRARTPNLDALAQQGVLFTDHYCNSPLCVPSRLSFISGKYISRTGVWSNTLPSADYPTLPRILTQAGYQSFLCGKMHFDRTRRYGFTEIWKSPLNQHHKTGRGRRRNPDDLKPKPGISERFKDFHTGDVSRVLKHDRQTTHWAQDFLSRRKRRDGPFFLAIGYLAPHFPLIVPQAYWEHFAGQIPLPVIPPGHLESQPLNYKHLRIAFNVEDAPVEIVRRGRELYYGLTEWVDVEIGKVLAALQQSDVGRNTVVVYTADHGENMGEHGLWWKNCMYQHASRVPLIVSFPERWKGGQVRRGACSLVDVAATVAALAGASMPDDWDGDSLLPWLDDPEAAWKDSALSEYYGHNIASGFVMLRRGRFKYVYHTPPDARHPAQRELYDLSQDPGEFNNLADQPAYKAVVEDLHTQMLRELGEHPDETEQRCRRDYARGYGRG